MFSRFIEDIVMEGSVCSKQFRPKNVDPERTSLIGYIISSQ